MDPQLEQYLKKTADTLKAQGKSNDEIKAATKTVYDKYNEMHPQGATDAPADGGGIGGFLKGLGKDIIHPFVKVGSTIEEGLSAAGAGAADLLGAPNVADQFRKTGEAVAPQAATSVLDFAGATAEAASYGMAPLKAGAGFWGTVKAALPMAATFGAGKGAQELAQGESPGKAALSTVGNTIGAVAGYGLIKGAGNLFANWGARALQSEAVRTAGTWAKDFAEKTWSALPEVFDSKAFTSVSDFVNKSTYRTVNALRDEFNTNWKSASDAIVSQLVPDVKAPDLAFSKFQRSLSETMGDMFRKSNALYDDVKADATRIEGLDRAKTALDKIPTGEISGKMTPEQFNAFQEAQKGSSELLRDFGARMKSAISQPLTLRQIMGLWNEAMGYLPRANNEERAAIRDFAQGLFADARKNLTDTKNPLVDQWDLAYQAWKKAGDVYESSILNNLKGVGDVDTFVDGMLNKGLNRAEQNAFLESIKGNEKGVQDLFISSLLRKVQAMDPADGAKVIRQFLDNWDLEGTQNAFLNPHQVKMLDDIATFMSGTFDDFVVGMRGAQGLGEEAGKTATEAAPDLLGKQSSLDISKLVADGRLDQIAENFFKLKDGSDLEKVMNLLTDEEKQVVGISIVKDLFNEKLPIGGLNKDGTYKVNKEFTQAIMDTWEKVSENKTLMKVLDEDQVFYLRSAAEYAKDMDSLSNVPAAGFKRLLNGVISVFYFARGWVPGGIRNAIEAASGAGEKTRAYYDTMHKMIEDEVVGKNARVRIGDIIKLLLPVAGPAVSDTADHMVDQPTQ